MFFFGWVILSQPNEQAVLKLEAKVQAEAGEGRSSVPPEPSGRRGSGTPSGSQGSPPTGSQRTKAD